MKKAWIIRRNEEAVSPVIATILMVAITVVLAAVLYVMVSGLIGGTTTAEPNVQFSAATSSANDTWTVTVAGVSEAKELGSFKAVLTKDAAQDSNLDPLAHGSTSGNIHFSDLDGGGKLSVGDYFTITTTTGSNYKLSVIWKESGNERGSESWET